jgi:hypothetical protein
MQPKKRERRLLLRAAAIGTGALLASCSNDIIGIEPPDAASDSVEVPDHLFGLPPHDGGFVGRTADAAGIRPVEAGDEFVGSFVDGAGIEPFDGGMGTAIDGAGAPDAADEMLLGSVFDAAGIGPVDGGIDVLGKTFDAAGVHPIDGGKVG